MGLEMEFYPNKQLEIINQYYHLFWAMEPGNSLPFCFDRHIKPDTDKGITLQKRIHKKHTSITCSTAATQPGSSPGAVHLFCQGFSPLQEGDSNPS